MIRTPKARASRSSSRSGIGVELDLAEPVVGDGHEQPADGSVHEVVGDVEQPLGGRGVAEAAIELC